MFYQVRANLYFKSKDDAMKFFKAGSVAFIQATDVNPGKINTDFSIIELIENHHDEDPPAPCDCIVRFCSHPPETKGG